MGSKPSVGFESTGAGADGVGVKLKKKLPLYLYENCWLSKHICPNSKIVKGGCHPSVFPL
jgi:hypothetical protein